MFEGQAAFEFYDILNRVFVLSRLVITDLYLTLGAFYDGSNFVHVG